MKVVPTGRGWILDPEATQQEVKPQWVKDLEAFSLRQRKEKIDWNNLFHFYLKEM